MKQEDSLPQRRVISNPATSLNSDLDNDPAAPPSSQSGKQQSSQDYGLLKRLVYRIVFPLFFGSSVLAIVAGEQAFFLEALVGTLALVFGWLSIRSWRRELPSRRAEWVAIVSAALFWVAYQLYWRQQDEIGIEILLSFASWSPIFLLLVFIALPTRPAVGVSSAFYVVMGALTVGSLEALPLPQPESRLIFLSTFVLAPLGTIAMLVILSELRERSRKYSATSEQFQELAYTDVLTQVPNRLSLSEALDDELERAVRYHQELCVIAFDVDHFKQINDQWGHPLGDEVLKRLARSADSVVRQADVFGRWGGDEFIVVCPSTSAAEAEEFAGRIRLQLAEISYPKDLKVTCSFGVAARVAGDTGSNLLKRADRALYSAKSAGRDCIVTAGDD